MNNLLHYQNVSHYQKVKKTTEVLIILICSRKIKVFFLRKLIACVQIAERSASAGISYSQLQIQILLQKMSSMMRIFPIISWSKVKKTTEVIILIYIQKQKSFFPVKSTYLFKMLRGVQVQVFLIHNYKFKLCYK